MTNLLDDAVLVVAGGEVVDALVFGLHIADQLELGVGRQQRTRNIVEALAEHLLLTPSCASTIFAPNHGARFQG